LADSSASPFPRARLGITLALVIYALGFAYASWQGVHKPVLNWDMMGYVGSILRMKQDDPTALHEAMKEEVRPFLPDWLAEQYFEQNPLSARAQDFYQQIPFYDIKPLYVVAVWAVHALGVPMVQATWVVSALAFAGIGFVLACWRPMQGSRALWLLGISALLFIGPLPFAMLAAYSTPDALSLFFLMGGFVCWLRRHSLLLLGAGLVLSVFTRPDTLVACGALLCYLTFFAHPAHRLSLARGIALSLLVIAAYALLQAVIGSAGWEVLFYRGFINDNLDFAHADIHVTRAQYMQALFGGIRHLLVNPRLMLFAALSVVSVFCFLVRPEGQRGWLWLLVMAWVTFLVRFMLFPNWADERYFYYFYLLMLMAIIELTAPLLHSGLIVSRASVVAFLLALFVLTPQVASLLERLHSTPAPALSGISDAGSQYQQGLTAYSAKDYQNAAAWWQKAAAQDHAAAMYGLGNLYANGQGVAASRAKALRWYKRGAALGDRDAMFALGYCYEHGLGAARNPIDSYAWYSLAADAGHSMGAKAAAHIAASLPAEAIKRAEKRKAVLR